MKKPIFFGLLSILILALITLSGYYSVFWHSTWTIRQISLQDHPTIRIKLTEILNSDEIQQKIRAINNSNILFTKNTLNIATYDACLKQWYVNQTPTEQCPERHMSIKQTNQLLQMLKQLADPSTLFLGRHIFFNMLTDSHSINLTNLSSKLHIPSQLFHFHNRRLHPSQVDENNRKNIRNPETLQLLIPDIEPFPCLYSNKPCRSHSIYETSQQGHYSHQSSSSILSSDNMQMAPLVFLHWLGYNLTVQDNQKIPLWFRLQLFKAYQIYHKELRLIDYMREHSDTYQVTRSSLDTIQQWLYACHSIQQSILAGSYSQSWLLAYYQPEVLNNREVCGAYLFPQDYVIGVYLPIIIPLVYPTIFLLKSLIR